MARIAIIVIVLSKLTVLILLGMVAAVIAPGVLLLPLLASRLAAWYGHPATAGHDARLLISNPTELRSAFSFGALYALVLVAAAWLSDWLGHRGLYVVSLIAGLTDVDAITLTSLRLHALEKLPVAIVIDVITLAILSNIAFKSAVALVLGGWDMARHAIAGMCAIAIGLLAAWAVLRVL